MVLSISNLNPDARPTSLEQLVYFHVAFSVYYAVYLLFKAVGNKTVAYIFTLLAEVGLFIAHFVVLDQNPLEVMQLPLLALWI